jgi:hypothetical protein
MIIYRTTGPWGPGVGANLTAPQVDGNFYDLSQRVQFIELNPVRPVEIASFTAFGNQLYINMSDGGVQGPITLPEVRWFFRGNWAPGIVYNVDDVVVGTDNAVYLVVRQHTSAAVFDPNANDGAGHTYYSLLLRVPAATLPTGGSPGSVLTKNTASNYDVVWLPPPAPPGGTGGQVLQKNSEVDGDAAWGDLVFDDLIDVVFDNPIHGEYLRWDGELQRWVNAPGTERIVMRASSWAPVPGDEGAFMVLTNGTADVTIMIPRDNNVDFAVGTELHVHQDGTGTVRIVGEDSAVTVLHHANFSNELLGQYATATVKKTGPYEWRLFGLLTGA